MWTEGELLQQLAKKFMAARYSFAQGGGFLRFIAPKAFYSGKV